MTRPIVALDVSSLDAASAIVARLGGACDFYKVGLQLFAAEGPRVVRWLRDQGKWVFIDLKAHDIPNTVRGVAGSLAALGASLITVHAAGGQAMVAAAVEGAGAQTAEGCRVLAVTVLTSFDQRSYGESTARPAVDLREEVLRLAGVARGAGAYGVVCSGHEALYVKAAHGSLGVLVPGVRAAGGEAHDQARIVTAREAARAGAEFVVVGRAVTGAADPAEAFHEITLELSQNPLPQVT